MKLADTIQTSGPRAKTAPAISAACSRIPRARRT
jgi:hypothetical protein